MVAPEPSPKSRRRRASLSLRGLMLLILVAGGLMGWRARKASLQRRAVAAIERAGGSVVYDTQMVGLKFLPIQSLNDSFKLPPGRSWAPDWLRRAIGEEYFRDVAVVWLNHGPSSERPVPGATDDLMRLLADLDGLVMLQVHDAAITDAGMAHLRGSTRLRGIMLHGVTITDAGLEPLRGMPNLEELHVFAHPDPITGAGMAHLAGLTRLRTLYLAHTRLDDRSLANLRGMTRLESLHISGSPIGDAGLAHLTALASLRHLGMDGSPALTDAGGASLAKLASLESLSLFDTGLTDTGLARLAALPRLERLQLYHAARIRGVGASALASPPLKSLDLGACAVDAAGLEQIGRIGRLENLGLQANPGVDDAGLPSLRGMTALVHLDLGSTRATSEGATALQDALPLLAVTVQSGTVPRAPRGKVAN